MANINGNDLATKIAKIEAPTSMQQWIESKKDMIQEALPKGYDVKRMVRVVVGALRQNPNLAKCTPISFISAVMQSIQLGLEPNTVLGHAYIIPYWNSHLKVFEAQFQRGYRGLLDMAYRTGQFMDIYANEVCKGDEFDYILGTESWVKHRLGKRIFDKSKNPTVEYVYAEYKNIKGGRHLVVWTKEMLDNHKDRYSPAAKKDKFSAWNVSETSMYRKTVLKDLLNYADISIEFRKQLQTDEVVKREIKPNMIDTVKPIYEFSPDDIKGMDDVEFESKKEEKKPEKETKKTDKINATKVDDLPDIPDDMLTEKPVEESLNKADLMVSQTDLAGFYAKLTELGLDKTKQEKVSDWVKTKYKVGSKKELTVGQLRKALDAVEAKLEANREGEKAIKEFNEQEPK